MARTCPFRMVGHSGDVTPGAATVQKPHTAGVIAASVACLKRECELWTKTGIAGKVVEGCALRITADSLAYAAPKKA